MIDLRYFPLKRSYAIEFEKKSKKILVLYHKYGLVCLVNAFILTFCSHLPLECEILSSSSGKLNLDWHGTEWRAKTATNMLSKRNGNNLRSVGCNWKEEELVLISSVNAPGKSKAQPNLIHRTLKLSQHAFIWHSTQSLTLDGPLCLTLELKIETNQFTPSFHPHTFTVC